MDRGIFPDKMKLKAVAVFAVTGVFATAAELSGIPEATIRKWAKQEWWVEALREIRQENNDKLDARFSEIIENALDQVHDRVENGDWARDSYGTLFRKPMSAKDLATTLAINIDKRQLLRGEATSRTESTTSIGQKTVDKLEKLAETFENLSKFRKKQPAIDITPVEVKQIENKEPNSGSQDPDSTPK